MPKCVAEMRAVRRIPSEFNPQVVIEAKLTDVLMPHFRGRNGWIKEGRATVTRPYSPYCDVKSGARTDSQQPFFGRKSHRIRRLRWSDPSWAVDNSAFSGWLRVSNLPDAVVRTGEGLRSGLVLQRLHI